MFCPGRRAPPPTISRANKTYDDIAKINVIHLDTSIAEVKWTTCGRLEAFHLSLLKLVIDKDGEVSKTFFGRKRNCIS